MKNEQANDNQTAINQASKRKLQAIKSLISTSKLEVFYRYFFHLVGSKYSSLRRGKLLLYGVYNILQTPRTHRCRSFFHKNTTSFCGSH